MEAAGARVVVVVVVVVDVVGAAVVVGVGVGVGVGVVVVVVGAVICTIMAVRCCLARVSLRTAAPTDMEMHPTPITLAYLRTDCPHTMVRFVVLDFAFVLRLCVVVAL